MTKGPSDYPALQMAIDTAEKALAFLKTDAGQTQGNPAAFVTLAVLFAFAKSGGNCRKYLRAVEEAESYETLGISKPFTFN